MRKEIDNQVGFPKAVERLAKKDPDLARTVLELREHNKCLLRLTTEEARMVQTKAIFELYTKDGCRILAGFDFVRIMKPNGTSEVVLKPNYKYFNE